MLMYCNITDQHCNCNYINANTPEYTINYQTINRVVACSRQHSIDIRLRTNMAQILYYKKTGYSKVESRILITSSSPLI